MFFVLA